MKKIICLLICVVLISGCMKKKEVTKNLTDYIMDTILLKTIVMEKEDKATLKVSITNQNTENKKITTLSVIVKNKNGDILEEYGIGLDLTLSASSTYKVDVSLEATFDEVNKVEYKIE